MTTEKKVLEKFRDLPPEKQKAVRDFVESLAENGSRDALRTLESLWAGLAINRNEENITEA